MSEFERRRSRYRYSPRAYQSARLRSVPSGHVEAEGPPCDHDAGECDVAELWPMAGETNQQFVARLTSKYSRIGVQAS